MSTRIATDCRLTIRASPREVWGRFADVGAYREWWPWLRRFDARALQPGDVWRCEVSPPLPYVVRFSLTIEETEVEQLVVASLVGDIRGMARLTIGPSAESGTRPVTELRLASDLEPARPLLRAVTWLAGPVARSGHDWVIETGARQFGERAFHPARPEALRPKDAAARGDHDLDAAEPTAPRSPPA